MGAGASTGSIDSGSIEAREHHLPSDGVQVSNEEDQGETEEEKGIRMQAQAESMWHHMMEYAVKNKEAKQEEKLQELAEEPKSPESLHGESIPSPHTNFPRQPPVNTQDPRGALVGGGAGGGRAIVCHSCQFSNDPENDMCALCDRKLPRQSEPPSRLRPERSAVKHEDRPKDGEPCPQCTFLNDAGRNYCEMCGLNLGSSHLRSKADAAAQAAARLASARREADDQVSSTYFELIQRATRTARDLTEQRQRPATTTGMPQQPEEEEEIEVSSDSDDDKRDGLHESHRTSGAPRMVSSLVEPVLGSSSEVKQANPPPAMVALKGRRAHSLEVMWDSELPELLRQTLQTHRNAEERSGPSVVGLLYDVQYRPIVEEGSVDWRCAAQQTSKSSCVVKDLSPDTQYQFRVRRTIAAFDGNTVRETLKRYPFSRVSCVIRTGPSTPGAPQPPTSAEATPTSLLIHWSPPQALHGLVVKEYVVQIKAFGGATEEFVECYRGLERVFVATGLVPKTIHVFRVAAINRLGQGPWSRNAAFRTSVWRKDDTEGCIGWIETVNGEGHTFYFHPRSQQSSWTLPRGAVVDREGTFRRRRQLLLERLHTNSAVALSSVEATSRAGGMHPDSPYTRIEVDRDELLHSSVTAFGLLRHTDFLKPLRIKYAGEEGIDSGGLVKDWFLEVSRCLLDGNLGLFAPLSEDCPDEFTIDRRSHHLHTMADLRAYFRFTGRFLGKAILDRQIVDLRLDRTALLQLLGQTVSMADLQALDYHRYKGLKWMLENSITGVLDETFSVCVEVFGDMVEIELKEGGQHITVTEENKQEYVDLMVDYSSRACVKEQLQALQEGFRELIPMDLLAEIGMQPDELNKMLLGDDEVDVASIEALAKYSGGYDESSEPVKWFWRVFKSFNANEQQQTLRFVTGLHKVPLDGFDPPFTIMRSTHESGIESLPRSHTCFNQLALPAYEDFDALDKKLRFAIANASSGFLIA